MIRTIGTALLLTTLAGLTCTPGVALAGPSDPCTVEQRDTISREIFAVRNAAIYFLPPTPSPNVPTTVYYAGKAREIEAPYLRFVEAANACARGTMGVTPSELTYGHAAGGFAAWGAGDIDEAIARFNLAGDTTRANQFQAWYSPVHLDFRQASTPRYLARPGRPPGELGTVFNNSQVVNRAYRAIALAGKYHGYLPPGTYTIAGRTFDVHLNQTTTASY